MAVAVLGATVALAAGCGGTTQAAIQVQGQGRVPAGLEGVLQSPPQPKPSFVLADTSGRPYDLAGATQGYATLLYFGYTHCPDECPTHMANIAAALSQVEPQVSSHVKVVFVTTDPPRDTPAVIRKWLDNFSTSFIGLSGTEAQIQAAEAGTGIDPNAGSEPTVPGATTTIPTGDYSVTHAAYVLAFTTDNLAHVIYPSGLGVKAWVHDLPELVRGWPKS
ncbi:MAG: SCO family protein [Candidatus Aeolococcus gillhamiae]|uniref:SCO family protein n=1 Tax=Candidatus Aeolococcus gillhamiae TaxID=3127015 RepID=A0A2W6A7R6_9BACT|nr:MAG: SCO family protein [Candidatus Dormibacter sp. RRmetagenome_bin12]